MLVAVFAGSAGSCSLYTSIFSKQVKFNMQEAGWGRCFVAFQGPNGS